MSQITDPLALRALDLIQAGIRAADPEHATSAALPDLLANPPAGGGVWHIIALGKAARAMAKAALDALPQARALVVTNAGNDARLPRAEILVSGHPVPDAAGEAAARRVEDVLAGAKPGDRVLALISGGGSAMLPAPVEGVSLAQKQEVNRILLGAGADIAQMNLIRQALSRLKGGGWLRASRAPVTALILSDVPGDDLRVIASGPTVAPIGSVAQAADMARELQIWDDLPDAVQTALQRPQDRRALPPATNILIGSNAQSVAAIIAAGARDGGAELTGDVEDCARALVRAAQSVKPGEALVFGGETTVRLTGDGQGGRNQELALRFARAATDLPGNWAFAAIGSDGRDGPGEAAGGVVGPETLQRIRDAGIDLDQALSRNDSGPVLQAAGGLVVTGATGTNVADLALFIRES
ncbi:glycerate kinase type-2 family protein [Paracoccus fistulariae]|uniref:DUF4147 domain-containing protein n=1 Tax=Paracoccus fistulariae TaxID=658446 RepID=A0ABY7SIX5_9RHOB|nr:DUF4147 domain-containing protein [Paracoccus fistulariae]MDB6180820.1 DUF4147 domain-containing protein [Paracoccus fistulariae]WCR06960.1 DUF4147 domain-containing protein [Paracoccus fistulariae]